MTLFGSRPGLEVPDEPEMRDIHDCSSGTRIRIKECIYSMLRRMQDCASLVEAIEEKRLDNERKTKGWNKAGKPDPDAEELFDQFVASGNKLGAVLKRLQSTAAFEEAKEEGVQICARAREELRRPLDKMMEGQWSSQADPAENSKKRDWKQYSEICRSLTSEMIAHLATYNLDEEEGEEKGGVAQGERTQAGKKKNRASKGLLRCKMS